MRSAPRVDPKTLLAAEERRLTPIKTSPFVIGVHRRLTLLCSADTRFSSHRSAARKIGTGVSIRFLGGVNTLGRPQEVRVSTRQARVPWHECLRHIATADDVKLFLRDSLGCRFPHQPWRVNRRPPDVRNEDISASHK